MKNKEIKNNLILLGLDKVEFLKDNIKMVALFNTNNILTEEVYNEINDYEINKNNKYIAFMTKEQFDNIFLENY